MNIEKQSGPDVELKSLFEQTMENIVPRLLRPLETGGRQMKPSLVHGDLYSGNVSISIEAGKPILYEATCLYAHNECERSHLITIA